MGHPSLLKGPFKSVFEFRVGAMTLKMCHWGTGDGNGLAFAVDTFTELRTQGHLGLW